MQTGRSIGIRSTRRPRTGAAIAAGRLKIVLADFDAAPLPVAIVYTGYGKMPLKTRSFLGSAAPRLKREIGRLDLQSGFSEARCRNAPPQEASVLPALSF